MRAAYYAIPELTLLTCSDSCHRDAVADYAARDYVPYIGDDGRPLVESDAATRELIARGELPAAERCDHCRAPLDSRVAWNSAHGWHWCTAFRSACTDCARRGRFSWRVHGICERCDGPPLMECCDGNALE